MLRVQCVHNKCTYREQGLITVSFAIMYTIVCVSTICTALPNRELLQRSKAGLYKLLYHVERSFINVHCKIHVMVVTVVMTNATLV